MKSFIFASIFLIGLVLVSFVHGTTSPVITNWVESTGGTYDGSYTDVTGIYYDSDYVYITANGLPDYTIGPWNDNPNSATGQSYSFQITRNP